MAGVGAQLNDFLFLDDPRGRIGERTPEAIRLAMRGHICAEIVSSRCGSCGLITTRLL